MNESEYDELKRLRSENARLRALLARHGIVADEPASSIPQKPSLSLEEKVNLFRSLFQGREDVFARRWFSSSTGKSGYQPVCSREWNREYCNKKKYKCAECPNREFQPLGYNDIYRHLEGKDPDGRDVVGVYAILEDNTCNFLCCDFDDKSCEHGYQDDVRAYVSVCRDWNIPAYIERSRSGNGAHVWILFSGQFRHDRHVGLAMRFSRKQWSVRGICRSNLTTASSPIRTSCRQEVSAILWLYRCRAELVKMGTVFLSIMTSSHSLTNGLICKG